MSSKVVVTGASGHIGFHVASVLLEKGYEVHLPLRRETPLTDRLRARGATVQTLDFNDDAALRGVVTGAAGLFHLAAQNTTSQATGHEVAASTLGLTERVIAAALASGVPTVVYTSSVVVLGRSPDPDKLINEDDLTASAESPYVQGKSDAEKFVRATIASGADIRVLYPSWVVGPDDPKCTPPHKLILDYVTKGQAFAFEGGISIAHVRDVAAAHVAAFEKGAPRGRWVLGGVNVDFPGFYRLLARFAKRKPPAVLLPKPAMMTAAQGAKAVSGAMGRESPVDPAYIEAVVGNYSWYDSGKAVRELDYHITPIETSLAEAVRFARQRLAGTYTLNQRIAGKTADGPPPGDDDRLLITGSPGWMGNRLIDLLINGDRFGEKTPRRKVRLLQHPSAQGLMETPPDFEIVYADINDEEAVKKALAGVKAVYHLAGLIYPPKIDLLYTVNTEGTKTLVDACIETGVRRIIYMGTDSICGHGTAEKRRFDEHTPATPYKHYGESKYQGEKYVLDKTAEGKIDGTSLRGFWFFGPYAPARNMGFVKMFFWPRQIVFGDGKNLRSISHVDNIAQAFFRAENRPATYGKWYWIGDGEGGYTVDQIYRSIAGALGVEYRPFYVPKFACDLLGEVDNVIGKFGRINPTIQAAGKFHHDIAGSSAAAARDFGYDPRVTLADAAREMKEFL